MIPDGTGATTIKVGTTPVELILDISGQVVTAGKAIFVVEYTITGVA
jgi:hypothetical protein